MQGLVSFSTLQRAEIAEISTVPSRGLQRRSFSTLQRAEIAEILRLLHSRDLYERFSTLQRAEIAEIVRKSISVCGRSRVSVLFNEPKLLKFDRQ